ncbi:glycosyltransferase family 39 protein [Streptomyces sp. NPDC059740]|uniref:glycosyltransferase family 39 protein n=1 Tax=Streptomyces sp. NPDC059740 TaxID=3346926 RepID=UPI0036476B47
MRETLLPDDTPDRAPASAPAPTASPAPTTSPDASATTALSRPVTPRPRSRPLPSGPRRPHSGATGRATLTVALVPAAVMLVLGLWGLRRGTMWRDEAATFQVARRTLPQIWHTLGSVDAVHGLYYLLMHPLLAVRPDEVTLRLPSVVGAATACATVALLGQRLAGPRTGLCAGLLLAAAPVASHYAQEGRSYAVVAAGAAAATLLLTVAVERGTVRSWAAYAAVTALTCQLHELAVLLLCAHAVTLAVSAVGARAWRAFLASGAAVCLTLVPLWWVSRGQSAQLAWLHPPGPRQALELVVGLVGPSRAVLFLTLALMAVALCRPLPRRTRLGLVAVAAPLALVPPVVLYVLSQRQPLFLERYLLWTVLGVALLTAAGVERLLRAVLGRRSGAPARRLALATVLAGATAALLWQLPAQHHERRPGSRPDDLAAVARQVAAGSRPGDGVLFVPSYERRVAETYPRAFRGLRDLSVRVSGPESGTLYGTDTALAVTRARMAGVHRVWVVADPRAVGARWFAHSRRERPRWDLLHSLFHQSGAADRRASVRLFVR